LFPGAQGNEATVVRYIMPDGSGYVLQQDAVYTLPIQGGGNIDIAPSTSLLWMTDNNQVQLGVSMFVGAHSLFGFHKAAIECPWSPDRGA